MALKVPGTTFDPLGPQTAHKMTAHDIFCCHTMAGGFEGTDSMFHANGYVGTESHLGMRWDGFTKQWQDLLYRADANFEGNPRVISLETEDVDPHFPSWYPNGPVPKWTDEQCEKIVQLIRTVCAKSFHANCPVGWKCRTEGIPIVLIPDTRSTRRGIGYHRQGIDGNFTGPYKGRQGVGERWSTGTGKPCPGDARITQLIYEIIPEAQGDDMTPAQAQQLKRIEDRGIAMYKALRNDDDADQALVRGIREHVRVVVDDASNEDGSALRTMVLNKSKDALAQYPVAKADSDPT